MYRLTGWALIAVGVVFAVLAIVLGWDLAIALAVVCLVAGAVVLADRPEPLPRTYGDELREQRRQARAVADHVVDLIEANPGKLYYGARD